MTFPSFEQAAAGGLDLWAAQQLAAHLDRPDDAAVLFAAWASSRGVLNEQARDAKNGRIVSDAFRARVNKMPQPAEHTPPRELSELIEWVDQWAGSTLDPLADLVAIADDQNPLRRYVRARDEHAAQMLISRETTGAERRTARELAAVAARQRDELHDSAALFVAQLAHAWASSAMTRPTYKNPQLQAASAGKW